MIAYRQLEILEFERLTKEGSISPRSRHMDSIEHPPRRNIVRVNETDIFDVFEQPYGKEEVRNGAEMTGKVEYSHPVEESSHNLAVCQWMVTPPQVLT